MKKTRSEAITVAWPKSAMATWPSRTMMIAAILMAVPLPRPATDESSTRAKTARTEFTATHPDAESQLNSAAG